MAKYTYNVVTHNGSGVHGHGYRSLPKAREAARQIATEWAGFASRLSDMSNDFEIQRVREWSYGAQSYWMRRRSRWVPWDPVLDAEARRPDFVVRVLDGGEIVEGWD